MQKYDSMAQTAIRRLARSFYRKNTLPTFKNVKATFVKDTDMCKVPISTLRRILKNMGFKFTRRKKNSMLIVRDDIIAWRHRAQLVYHGKKDGEYHDEMTSAMYEKYFADKLLPNLPVNSVIVLDNVSIHSRKDEKVPVKKNNKAEIRSWLVSKAIPVGEDLHKTELLEMVESVWSQYEPKCKIN
ncbi:hypothetical protein ANN_19950 [Periplaneta americana]|uniref:Tc1-like transposase DDE domain-containing protein n=1 Tax=Periplaneta americana TaxID=6978 RepID=A0ABQ8SBA9_PERAM|nr:hypothetical protein ANN_19950 [Periplaneta americana]